MPERVLTDEQKTEYEAKFAALGFTFKSEGIGEDSFGFMVQHGTEPRRYDYRYREGESVTELLDRILVELA